MKKIFAVIICAMPLWLSSPAFARQQNDSKLTKSIKKTSDTIGVRTKKTVKKGTAKIADKTYSDKVGPDGQTVYIDKHSKYYYIDGKGNKAYITKDKLKDK